MKKILILIMTISILLVGCSTNKIKVRNSEYELLNITTYNKIQTNTFGGIVNTEEWLRYSFSDNGNIITRDRNFDGIQQDKYRLHKSTDGKAKVIDKSDSSNASLDFYLTDKMYDKLNN